MPPRPLLDDLPIWSLGLLTVVLALLMMELGYRLAARRRQRSSSPAPDASIVGACLGLLAFMLAFTFGIAASRHDTRRDLVLEEANAIGTVSLRADLLPEPQRAAVLKLLLDYVEARLSVTTAEEIPRLIAQSEAILDALWTEAVTSAKEDSKSVMVGLFVEALNDLIDLHSKRLVAGIGSRIPATIWAALLVMASLGMISIGFQAGLAGARGGLTGLALALAFSLVILLIASLDRPLAGTLRVSQQPLVAARDSLLARGR